MIILCIFYITIKYELNNELIIFWNFGVPKFQITNFIFKISLFLFFFQIILTSIVIPKSQDLARSFLKSSSVNFFGNFIKSQKFNDTIKGLTIYSDKKDTIQKNIPNEIVKYINDGKLILLLSTSTEFDTDHFWYKVIKYCESIGIDKNKIFILNSNFKTQIPNSFKLSLRNFE